MRARQALRGAGLGASPAVGRTEGQAAGAAAKVGLQTARLEGPDTPAMGSTPGASREGALGPGAAAAWEVGEHPPVPFPKPARVCQLA